MKYFKAISILISEIHVWVWALILWCRGKNIHDGTFNYKHCFRVIDVIKNYWISYRFGCYLAANKTCFFKKTILLTTIIVICLGLLWWWSGLAPQLYVSIILQAKIATEDHWSIIVYHEKRAYNQNIGRFLKQMEWTGIKAIYVRLTGIREKKQVLTICLIFQFRQTNCRKSEKNLKQERIFWKNIKLHHKNYICDTKMPNVN